MTTEQRIAALERFINLTGKSGLVNLIPVFRALAQLLELDPNEVVPVQN